MCSSSVVGISFELKGEGTDYPFHHLCFISVAIPSLHRLVVSHFYTSSCLSILESNIRH